MDEESLLEMLKEAILNDNPSGDCVVRSFEEAYIMSSNKGLVLSFSDGSEFQLPIIQSR